jgi:benzoyl-CoA reductase/2-hydroxyglutaryl-CoA dehydratase subunit BcrC/BadD/HgdB
METTILLTLEQWDEHYRELRSQGMREPSYGGPLSRHACDGDRRLLKIRFDSSAASLRLWNLILTEEDRLHDASRKGRRIVGTMKDLGTVPVMAYSMADTIAFYPDGAWWLPCFKEQKTNLLGVADSLGINESFCPVRAMLGAFVTKAHFPIPDMLICSVGATCDDFSVIAQRLDSLGFPVFWWEIPHRRRPDPGEESVLLPGGFQALKRQVDFTHSELLRVKKAMEKRLGSTLTDEMLAEGIREANKVRRLLASLREMVFTSSPCPLPALEMLLAEMLAIHYCSDRDETVEVLNGLLEEVRSRKAAGIGLPVKGAVRIFWVNPVADIRVMNLLEECGGRICGTDYLFCHAIDEIPEDLPPLEALAEMALADPMAGSALDRAERICSDIVKYGAEALVISRIPGASHCASEGIIIGEAVRSRLGIPVVEIEVPPLSDSVRPGLCTRLEALIETVREGRKQ